MTKHKSRKRKVAKYRSRAAANAHAARLRAEGHKATVTRDSFGNFVVTIVEAVVVLSLLGAFLHPNT